MPPKISCQNQTLKVMAALARLIAKCTPEYQPSAEVLQAFLEAVAHNNEFESATGHKKRLQIIEQRLGALETREGLSGVVDPTPLPDNFPSFAT